MKCNQCTKPAMFAIPAEGGTVPLCLDCKIKFNRMLQDQTRELERSHNFIMDLWDEATGLPGIGPRYPAVAPPVQIGEVRLHNIKIDHSTIGVLNTGNLEMVDSAVTVLRGESAEGARVAEAVLALTQAVLASNLSTAAKNEAVELLGGVAAEASAPKEKRRSAMARALIDRLAVIVTNGAALVDLWGRVKPILDAMFPG